MRGDYSTDNKRDIIEDIICEAIYVFIIRDVWKVALPVLDWISYLRYGEIIGWFFMVCLALVTIVIVPLPLVESIKDAIIEWIRRL